MRTPSSENLLTIAFAIATPRQARERLIDMARRRQSIHVHLLNAYSVVLAHEDARLMSLLNEGLNYPDGTPLRWLSKLRGGKLHLVRGPTLFEAVLDECRGTDIRHFLLGGSEETLSSLVEAIAVKFPGANVVGFDSPPFRKPGKQELLRRDEMVKASGADIVWVGLGTPKQDFEVQRLAEELGVVAVAIGAAFDFTAGTKRVAPNWMSTLGLEWLFRLVTEPRRLWRRYLLGNTRFIALAAREMTSR
jgi:N-acetylglucosaminyldiphosphoundecaprenol N-acetyl-beta-D-mannosaminyltransferase